MQLICVKSQHEPIFLNQVTRNVTEEIQTQLDKRYISFEASLESYLP